VSATRFSLARWQSAIQTEPNHVEPAAIPACRPGSQTNPLPPGESLVCDPSTLIQSHYALVSTASQNYGDSSYRIAQQFDIAGRTGTIAFNASLYIDNFLVGFPTLAFTEDPYNAPSYLADNSGGPTPRNGVQIHFNAVCPGPAGLSMFPKVRSYDRHRETLLNDENGFANGCPSNVRTAAGKLNHVEIKLSQTHIEILATDASNDGINFGPLKKVYSAPLTLGFTRGFVSFGSHNHASEKYANLASWTVLWDNIAFDGPQLTSTRVSQVPNSAQLSGGGMNLGYNLPNAAGGGATAPLPLPGVATANVSSARLVFDMAADQISNRNWSAWRVNYRLNGGPWHSIGFSPDELAVIDRAGSYIFSTPVDPAELVNGTNSVQFSGSNFYAGYQPYIGNIDLVLL
jgi:hypothetical protein